jgi:hypothetical protein
LTPEHARTPARPLRKQPSRLRDPTRLRGFVGLTLRCEPPLGPVSEDVDTARRCRRRLSPSAPRLRHMCACGILLPGSRLAVDQRSRGVAAKHAALSRPRSGVRIPSGPPQRTSWMMTPLHLFGGRSCLGQLFTEAGTAVTIPDKPRRTSGILRLSEDQRQPGWHLREWHLFVGPPCGTGCCQNGTYVGGVCSG